ncbi:response regulator [Polluticoccus soli]|uniref:response regulator n=1 Tax=Polluticoccus soli TaxID=3034150 RepID=UPI0023E30C41|nr:response regulator [Flavipsychrobacter sp. JY13-12]
MKVMIFDDEIDVLQLYSMILQRRGHEVHTAQNCLHLMDKIEEVHPDVIIMDNEMPVLSGLQATKVLKEDTVYKAIPIICISANTEGAKLAKEAHADMFLPKPLGIRELEDAINKVTLKAA